MRIGLWVGSNLRRKVPTPMVPTTGQIGTTFIVGTSALG